MICQKCSQEITNTEAKFCGNCGAELTAEARLPHIGKSRESGMFRITFPPVEVEADHRDAAEEIARRSAFGEDGEFPSYDIHFVHSTVTRDTHPFICNNCRNMVTEDDNGKCEDCGANNWVKRTDDTEVELQCPVVIDLDMEKHYSSGFHKFLCGKCQKTISTSDKDKCINCGPTNWVVRSHI